MSGHGERKARVPTFDGKIENYEEFEMQWNTFSQVEGFLDALMAKGHPDMPTDYKTAIPHEGQGQGKKEARAKKESAKAVAYYTLAFKSARLRAIINKDKTEEWPGGEAWMINAAFIKKYRPDDIIAAAEANRRINDVSMKKYDDPAILFEQLAEIEVAYAGTTIKITEQDCIGVVFATAAEKYHSVLTSEQRTKGADLTMDDLEDAMNQLWRKGGGSQNKQTGNDGGEMVLSAFGGTCYNYQEKGHRANQCPKKDGPNNGHRNASGNTRGKFKGECNNCGKIGDKKSDCWHLEEHKNKRPKDYRRGNAEHGNAVISSGTGDEDSDAEFLMCAVEYEEEGANDKDIATLDEEHEFDEDETFDFVSEN
jgi:hypothetical protein